jgi:hypothetical protein
MAGMDKAQDAVFVHDEVVAVCVKKFSALGPAFD